LLLPKRIPICGPWPLGGGATQGVSTGIEFISRHGVAGVLSLIKGLKAERFLLLGSRSKRVILERERGKE